MPMYRVQTFFTGTPVSDGLSTVFYDAAAGTPGQAQSAHVAFLENFTTRIAEAQNWVVSGTVDLIDETTGTLIDSTSGPDESISTTATDAPLSPALQLLCRLSTGVVVGGRRLQGRMFLSGFTELSNVAGGQLDAALVTDGSSALNDWATGSADAQPVVWHRPNGGAGSKSPIIGGSIWSQWAVLRRRRPSGS